MMERKQINDEYKWDLSDYYPSLEKWKDDFDFVKQEMNKITYFENKLTDDKTIIECLKFSSELSKIFSRLYCFASLRTKEDATNNQFQQLYERIDNLYVQYSTLSSFVSVELSKLPTPQLKRLSQNSDAKNFDLLFKDMIKMKPHILSKKEEKLLSQMGEFAGGFSDNFDKFENADLTFADAENISGEKLPLDQSLYGLYLQSSDRVLRKNAMKNILQGFGDYNFTLASNYISEVKLDCFNAKIRKYKSALAAALFGEEIPEKVYKTLIASVNNNLDKFYDYYELKRKQLKLDEMHSYDFAAPTNEKFSLKLNFDEAMNLIYKACSVLGEDYVNMLKTARKQRWIDIYPSKGKDNGAFSSGCYGCKPVVLLNYTMTTNDIFTIAHELGHALHTHYSNTNQCYEKSDYEIFVAEVASTVKEMLLLRYMLNNATSKEEKIYYYDYFLKMARTTIARQTMFAEFEQFVHEQVENNNPLSAEVLNNYYYSLNKKYFGEKVVLLDEIKYEWSRIPHFYNSFYVYKYATGLISAIILSEKLFNQEKGAKEKYLHFLSSGSSKPPVELLKDAGVNLEKQSTFDFAFNIINMFIKNWNNVLEEE